MRNKYCTSYNTARNTEKIKNEKYTQQSCIMARELKNVENETQTLFDLEYGKKNSKACKMKNTHCRSQNMARNTEKREK